MRDGPAAPEAAGDARTLRVGFLAAHLGLGGAERQLTLLARGLARRGGEVAVACLSNQREPYGAELDRAGVSVTVIPRRGSWDLGRLLALRAWLRQWRPDFLCAFGEFAGAYGHYAGWGLRRPPRLALMLRRSALPWTPLKLALVRHVFRRADLVCANSRAGRDYVARTFGLAAEQVSILPNALPQEVADRENDRVAVRDSLGISADMPVVAYVGRQAPAKDIPTLCRTLERLALSGLRFRALVMGHGLDGPPAGTRFPGNSPIRWLGPRADALSLIGASELLLLTSRSEGTPNVVLEAMALGRAVVATAVGDVPRLLADGPAGVVLPAGDDAGLAREVERLLGSPDERAALGRAGRARVLRDFDEAAAVDRLAAFLHCKAGASHSSVA